MKVLILPKYDSNGASSRYRFYNYLTYFESNGVQCFFKPLLEAGYTTNLYNKRKVLVFLQQILAVFKRFFFLLNSSYGQIEQSVTTSVFYLFFYLSNRERPWYFDY